jgi:hypothetical protein
LAIENRSLEDELAQVGIVNSGNFSQFYVAQILAGAFQ